MKTTPAVIALLILACVVLVGVSITHAAPPNVLFIAIDDMNDWVSPLGGYEGCKTPNLERVAKRGVTFTRAYCAAPACNPSRASLMTGVRPWTSGVYTNGQPWRKPLRNAVTLTEHYREHGYEVVGAGKIYHGGGGGTKLWDDYQPGKANPTRSAEVIAARGKRAGTLVFAPLAAEDADMGDYHTANYSIEYLGKSHDKPFFLACGIIKPHLPWEVPQEFFDMYPLDSIRLPEVQENDLADVPAAGVKMAKPDGDHAKILRTNTWKQAVQGYLASITFADRQIGRVLDALEKSKFNDNTIVVVWGDHGWHLGEKEHWRKFALWEEATHSPLFIAAAGVTTGGTRCERTVDFMDIYPTLCELCSLPSPKQELEGVSLVPQLRDPGAKRDRPAMTTHIRGNHAIRSERYRYIRYIDGSEELYDHDSDPHEWTNVAASPDHAKAKRELAKWLPKKDAPDAPREGKGEE